jgi:hypothetical protein
MDVVEANLDGEDEGGEAMEEAKAKKLGRALRKLEEYGAGAGDNYYGTNGTRQHR